MSRFLNSCETINNVSLIELDPSQLGQYYVDWLNDYEVVKYTEARFSKYDLSSARQYIAAINESKTDYIWGIIYKGSHVGNIKLGMINYEHKTGYLSYLIGDKSCYGRGIGTFSVGKIVGAASSDFGLEKLKAGYYINNVGSARVLEKNGFSIEGVLKYDAVFEGARIDTVIVGRVLVT